MKNPSLQEEQVSEEQEVQAKLQSTNFMQSEVKIDGLFTQECSKNLESSVRVLAELPNFLSW